MDPVIRFVRGFGRFWYDFIVGDDPKIAVAVVAVLLVGAVLVGALGLSGPLFMTVLAALLLAAWAIAMLLDVRRSLRKV